VYGPPGNAEWFDYVVEARWVDCRKRFHDEEQQTFFRKGATPDQLDHLSVDPDSAERLSRDLPPTSDTPTASSPSVGLRRRI
jgi:hypothetical protein